MGDRPGHARAGQPGAPFRGPGPVGQRAAQRKGTDGGGTAESGGGADYGEHEAGTHLEVAGLAGYGGGDGPGHLGRRRVLCPGPAGAGGPGAGGTGAPGALGSLHQLRQSPGGGRRGGGHGELFPGAGHENPGQPQEPACPGDGIPGGLHGRSPLGPGGGVVHELLAEGRGLPGQGGPSRPLPHPQRPVPHRAGVQGAGPVELRHPGGAHHRGLRRGAAGGGVLL